MGIEFIIDTKNRSAQREELGAHHNRTACYITVGGHLLTNEGQSGSHSERRDSDEFFYFSRDKHKLKSNQKPVPTDSERAD